MTGPESPEHRNGQDLPEAPPDGTGTHPRRTGLETSNQRAVFRFVGLGTELAGFTLVFAGLGYLIDSISQFPKPYGTAFGALLGFALGMARFVMQARQSDKH